MFAAHPFNNRRVAVFGLARSGLACIDALMAGGADVAAWDDNPAAREALAGSGVRVQDFTASGLPGFDALVLSPGVPLTHPEPHWSVRMAREAGVEIIGDTEVFARTIKDTGARMVAVTGTNGKSTTTALIGHVLSEGGLDAHVGGNIGKAVFLLPPPTPDRVYVLELSSYQIDLMPSLKPDVGVLMNLSPDHLDRHGDMAGYAAVKARMFALQDGSDMAVVSVDDSHCRAIAGALMHLPGLQRMSVETRLDDGVSAPDGRLTDSKGGEIDLTGKRGLRGKHNWQNACAAWCAARALGLERDVIEAGMASFAGLAHRMEEISRKGNVLFINDSKATNAEAAGHALASFDRVYWIAGGRAKSGGIGELAPFFGRLCGAYLVGEAAADFAATLEGHTTVRQCGTIDVAVEAAVRDAATHERGEVAVLLSPACASFDQFPDFEARGEAFRAAVHALDEIIPSNKEAT